ncbi:O-antigen ligase family protein [Bacillus sp. IITD106]|nr:O-antigen ligase family protein [Bacillus sp. IITD106]
MYTVLISIITFLSIFTYAGTFEYIIRIYPSELLFAILFIPFILSNKKTLRITSQDFLLFGFIALFLIMHLISLIVISYTNSANLAYSLREFVRIIISLPIVIVIIMGYRSKYLNVVTVLKIFIFAGVFTSLYAIYQYFSFRLIGKYYSLIPNSSIVPNINGRGVGTFMEGGYAVLFLGVSQWFLIYLFMIKKKGYRNLKFVFISIILCMGMFVTESTVGILGFIFSLLVFYLIKKGRFLFLTPKNLLAVIIFIPIFVNAITLFKSKLNALYLGITQVFHYGIANFDSNIGSFSSADRLTKIIKGMNMFIENPIFGVGLGQYGVEYHNYLPTSLTKDIGTVVPLNIFIEILSEMGFLGISIFLIILIILSYRLNPMLLSIFIFININFFTYPSYKMIFIWISFALIYILNKEDTVLSSSAKVQSLRSLNTYKTKNII